ncbi:MAG: phytanoyl-CoA dioxygenase family protein [Chloroflexota bacterium]
MLQTLQAPPEVIVTNEQLDHFDEFGYLVVEDALSPEKVAFFLEAIERVRTQLEASPARRQDHFGLNVRPIILHDDAFLELLEWPSTFPLAVRFLHHYSIQLMMSHLITVPPHPEKRSIGWHPDGGTPKFYVDGRQALTSLKIGYFLTDLLETNMGALMVVPGSHRLSGKPPFPKDARDPIGAIELKVKAGDAVIFHQGTWHASAPNYSDQTRVVLYYGYGYRVLRPTDYITMPQTLLDKVSPIGKQLLGHKETHMGYILPTEADCPLKAWYEERFGENWITDGSQVRADGSRVNGHQ